MPAGALLLDPFRTVVPAAAYSQPTAPEVASMSLLDAHCGTYQQVRARQQQWDQAAAAVAHLPRLTIEHVSNGCHTVAQAVLGANLGAAVSNSQVRCRSSSKQQSSAGCWVC